MHKYFRHFVLPVIMTIIGCNNLHAQPYVQNKLPLHQKPFMELPLGSIKPSGWLMEMLVSQRNGATGQLDKLYPLVMGERNGWLGGDGDQWERGPYWVDGLLPLAYLLDDDTLKQKAQKWVEWAIQSQTKEGYFGPAQDYEYEPGVQRDNAHDWWPKMVMLKILQQYYSATEDPRIVTLFTKYFDYQLKTLEEKPLGHWTFWAEYRSADNLQAVYWLYNITKNPKLIDLAELLHGQAFDFTQKFIDRNMLATHRSIHCVNLAQGLKEPVIYYQQNRDPKYLSAVKQGLSDIKLFNGQAQGMYGGDEALHGSNPTQGSELCSAVELMFSLEKMLEITGDVGFAEHLEKIAFNALPTQISDDFMRRQYFQQANQVQITRQMYNFDVNHSGTDLVFGLLTGYPCCTSNMHQGWPKFTQNLYYATANEGVASMIFAPSSVDVKVGKEDKFIHIEQETFYPFENKINLTITHQEKSIEFPYQIRIPSWTKDAVILINGKAFQSSPKPGSIIEIVRKWKDGDVLSLTFPMEFNYRTYHESSRSIERGPLVYALDIPGEEKEVFLEGQDKIEFGNSFIEVRPKADWNYGLPLFNKEEMNTLFSVKKIANRDKLNPWNRENAPIELTASARQLPFWNLYNGMAGPMPSADMHGVDINKLKEVQVRLIPYGCTTLRISQFPMIRK
ncbi:beta-L-arabinofuranosidase domain-containing protein [Sphingobacterium sp. JB170]|uniref:beta-L-arabinofuranosidase domain-containing protein n=1 Tax=Sphingobacterium sp. JB170 TaxID=1434842 RepID=UPI000B35CF24|nr:beta-L-arabinofuranosidase domain-containing protein [Sphingobacterium sp. JB170]